MTTVWRWMPVGMTDPVMHLVAGWQPSARVAERWDTACGKAEAPVIVIDEETKFCAACLQRVLIDGH